MIVLYYANKMLIWLVTILIFICVALIGWMFICNVLGMDTPRIGPIRVYVVVSDSMAPVFCRDDAIIVSEVSPDNLKPGDIITFHAIEPRIVITHRIIDVKQKSDGLSFRTKGDSNNAPDAFECGQESIIGKYITKIPRFGFIRNLMWEKPYTILLPVLLIIIHQFCFESWQRILYARIWLSNDVPIDTDKQKDDNIPAECVSVDKTPVENTESTSVSAHESEQNEILL